LDRDCTIKDILKSKTDNVPDRIALFMHVDRENFPQKLGPCTLMSVPFAAGDFSLPELTTEFKRVGFYWEMKRGVMEGYGLK